MLSVLIVTEYFPSVIQPWLLNTIEQIQLRGQVAIFANEHGTGNTPQKVLDLNLLPRTLHSRLTGLDLVKSAFLGPRTSQTGGLKNFITGLVRLGRPPLHPKKLLKHMALAHVAGTNRFDVIHAHHEINAYDAIPLCQRLRIPLVITFHGKPPPNVAELSGEKRLELYQQATLVQVNTQFAAKQVIALGCPREKIRILPQGLILDEFPFKPRAYPGNGEPLIILTIGRLQKDKGHVYAIDAVKALASRGLNVQYRIAGAGDPHVLQEHIKATGAEECVRLLGVLPLEKLLEEYQNSHIFILPSLRDQEGKHEETQGVVLQEAQASGKIVIATRTGGIPECLDDGVSAFLVPDRNASAIADTIEAILSRPEQWEPTAEQAREWVKTHFSMEEIGHRQWQLYHQAIQQHGTPA